MNNFIIQPSLDSNTNKKFLTKSTQAYYHQDYTTFGTCGNPDYLNHLKNQFHNTNINILNDAVRELTDVLREDLPKIKNFYPNSTLTVCVIPRAKKESYYSNNQKLFRKVVSDVVNQLDGYSNGTTYIIRIIDTKTTHMNRRGHGGNGEMPFAGITKDTCNISNNVIGKDILLIDDIYTNGVNIDEDAIQALLDKGARNVYFYSIGKTYKGPRAADKSVDDDLPSGDFQLSSSKDDSKLITDNKHLPGIPLYKKNYNGSTTYVAVLGDEIEKSGINALTNIDDDWYEIPVVSDLELLKVLTPTYAKCMMLTGFAANEKEADTLVAILKKLAVPFGYKGTIEKKLNRPTRHHQKSYTVKLNKNEPYKVDFDASLKFLDDIDWDD